MHLNRKYTNHTYVKINYKEKFYFTNASLSYFPDPSNLICEQRLKYDANGDPEGFEEVPFNSEFAPICNTNSTLVDNSQTFVIFENCTFTIIVFLDCEAISTIGEVKINKRDTVNAMFMFLDI